MSDSIKKEQGVAGKLWRRRVQILPIAFLMLFASAALGFRLRMFVAQAKPSLDRSPYIAVSEKADSFSRTVVERSTRTIPLHDLSFLEATVVPGPETLASNGANTGSTRRIRAIPLPPIPKLAGIMFSETQPSLAVLNGKNAGKDDVVGGWRVVLIEPEKVSIINDETGTEKVVILYENKKQE